MTKQADVVVIGGGITGTAILHELAKYNLRAVLVEQEPELAAGTTKANRDRKSTRLNSSHFH